MHDEQHDFQMQRKHLSLCSVDELNRNTKITCYVFISTFQSYSINKMVEMDCLFEVSSTQIICTFEMQYVW